ncbi:hypothetical protein HK101_002262 [Irineochytrium annulatum]|nr:hypothetical protein HK101_002262 [Irineochytrium annulatum]
MGSLLPNYLCNLEDLANGGPQSLADVIPHLEEDDGMMKVAGYHKQNVAPYGPQKLCTATVAGGLVQQQSQFTVSTIDPAQELLGLIVWIQGTLPSGQVVRLGEFTTPGLNMATYPRSGCGGAGTIVHTTALNDAAAVKSQSAPMTWQAPAGGIPAMQISVRGICVVEGPNETGGYGKFEIPLPVCPTAQSNPAVFNPPLPAVCSAVMAHPSMPAVMPAVMSTVKAVATQQMPAYMPTMPAAAGKPVASKPAATVMAKPTTVAMPAMAGMTAPGNILANAAPRSSASSITALLAASAIAALFL